MSFFPKIEITTSEYKELLKAKEQLETVKRYIQCGCYISRPDLEAILDIKRNYNLTDDYGVPHQTSVPPMPKVKRAEMQKRTAELRKTFNKDLNKDLDKDDSAKDPDEEQKG